MKVLVICILIVFVQSFYLPSATAENAGDILRKMEQTMRGDASYAEMTMQIIRPRYEREISMRAWSLGTDYSMIMITAPARDEGTAFLMRENNIWNYDPRIDRTTRMPSSMMAQSWMGSDFTNDDLVRDSDILEDYEHRIQRTESYEGHECYVIEMIPKPETPIVWGKVLVWVSKDNYIQLRIENYDQRNELANTLILDQIKRFGDRDIPSRFTVVPAGKENEKTILTYQKLDFDVTLSEDFFTQRNMQRLRGQ